MGEIYKYQKTEGGGSRCVICGGRLDIEICGEKTETTYTNIGTNKEKKFLRTGCSMCDNKQEEDIIW